MPIRFLFVLTLLGVVTACAPASEFHPSASTLRPATARPAPMAESMLASRSLSADSETADTVPIRTADAPQNPGDANSTDTARQVIYTGRLTVLSPDPASAIDAARQAAEAAGGYADSIRNQSIRLRVPAPRFDDVMQSIADLGLVTHRQIDAADVTAELVDLQIRLDNLEALRGRLKALLERTEAVEDALKIEKELGRLTGEIESIKGKLRLMKDRVALSTITATFNAPTGTASGLAGRINPFPWVGTVGGEAFGVLRLPDAQPKLGRAPKLQLPPGFVRFYQQNHRVFAIDRAQVVLKVTRHPNYDEADAGFWIDQVRDRLTRDLGVPVADPARIALNNEETALALVGERPAGDESLGYFVGLAANDDHVFVVEAWGPAPEIAQRQTALVDSLRTLRVSRGWW